MHGVGTCKKHQNMLLKKLMGIILGNNVELSWVDIVELAHDNCGSNTKLQTLYDWASKNVYTFKEGRKCSIKELNNWEASIRQNRRKARNFEPPIELVQTPEKEFDERPPVCPPIPIQPEPIFVQPAPILIQSPPKLESADKVNEELNYLYDFESTSPIDNDKIDVGDYFGHLVEDIKNCVETFERSKIPMRTATSDAAKQSCRIPNPYMATSSEPSVQFEFTVL